MMNPKLDRRVKYTRMALRESLLSLLETTPINRITVKDICERADVNRGTFYAHYQDPDALLTQIENDVLSAISDTVQRRAKAGAGTYGLLLELMHYIAENAALCNTLLGENGHANFLERVVGMARSPFLTVWREVYGEDADVSGEYPYTFVVNGNIGLIRHWLNDGMKEPPERVAAIADRMTYRGLAGYASEER